MNNKIDYIPEKNIEGQAKAVHDKTLLNLVQKRICKIKCSEGNGTGFFLNINIDEFDYSLRVRALITNRHVLNEDDIKPGKKISFSLNNDEEKYEIEIGKERKIYTSEIYDVTIIEIKDEDKLNKDSFFEIDDNIYNPNHNFNNKLIYLLYYPKGKGMLFQQGSIKNVDVKEKNYEIEYLCDSNSDDGSSGGPLINSIDYKVIGIDKGASKSNFNCGTLLKEAIIEFRKQIKNEDNKIKDIENKIIYNMKNEDIKNNKEEKKKNYLHELIGKKNEDKEDEITIRYKIEDIMDRKEIRLFGDEFVKNNRRKCKIIIDKKEFNLKTYVDINVNQLNNGIFEIKLKGIKKVTNMSYMFYNCESLSSLPNISKWKTQNVTDMKFMFYNCTSLSTLSDISKWNTLNVINMSEMFSYCYSLSSLPEISKWNTQNVTDISSMFYHCKSLFTLPDISKWNTQNVINMKGMFSGCKSLLSLPDISKWNTLNLKNISNMFSHCKSLSSLPDISKWNTQNVTNMSDLFSYCYSLSSLPDISKWNIQNVTNMSCMFFHCYSLSSLPDISKWNTSNMFSLCYSLLSRPSISQYTPKINMSSRPNASTRKSLLLLLADKFLLLFIYIFIIYTIYNIIIRNTKMESSK